MHNVILCTVDFSEGSKDALTYAVRLSKKFKSHITVLYTYRLLTTLDEDPLDIRTRVEQKAQREYALLEKEVLAGSRVPHDFKIEVGFVSNRVKEFAKANIIVFLVMSNRMNASSKESFDELADKVHVPLVIVP